jgi:hypothetical protein
MASERWIDEAEHESHAVPPSKVFCEACRYLYRTTPAFLCMHPHALVIHDTPEKRHKGYKTITERNANNDCPDFEVGRPWHPLFTPKELRAAAAWFMALAVAALVARLLG